jgi:hypothetical protein
MKRRARPDVVEALRAALEAMAGRAFDTPVALEEYVARAEIRRRIDDHRAGRKP